MIRRFRASFARLSRARDGLAAVEFALIMPVFLLITVAIVDIGHAFYMKLRIVNATTAAALYAQMNGQSLTSSTLGAFLSRVQAVAVASADLPEPPVVTVLFNNASDAANLNGFYCLSGFPAVWTGTGSASGTCGGSVSSGKFVTITISASTSTLLVSDTILGPTFATSDLAIVRVQ
ncbi:TadE/TadG family type IV pilus assembly protein [Methylobacterium sp. 77]|uniref:TadE/TadG family type IV pilus assembly protein n=1 Tax=Methylobacterium sp. 77 TaxID=1101192 RepID=UPI0003602B6F|nr:TadE/TadG family type IV pilus assembly protein [Methylobacterium sp. 77]